jgi:hypothetical protein
VEQSRVPLGNSAVRPVAPDEAAEEVLAATAVEVEVVVGFTSVEVGVVLVLDELDLTSKNSAALIEVEVEDTLEEVGEVALEEVEVVAEIVDTLSPTRTYFPSLIPC